MLVDIKHEVEKLIALHDCAVSEAGTHEGDLLTIAVGHQLRYLMNQIEQEESVKG